MTNYDKYKGEILNLAKTRYSDFYAAEALAAHDISGLADADNIIKWLFDEYEPPLLKNGDNLKTGDWIMVRNNKDNEWEKFRFVCYHNNAFWTLYDVGDWFHIGSKIKPWNQARLPMEGE